MQANYTAYPLPQQSMLKSFACLVILIAVPTHVEKNYEINKTCVVSLQFGVPVERLCWNWCP